MKISKMLMAICVVFVVAISSASLQAAVYNFDDGSLQGWTNSGAENYIAWDAAANSVSGRLAGASGDYLLVEEDYNNRDAGDTAVKRLSSPEFSINSTTTISALTLGGPGGIATPTWSNYADLTTTATIDDFMGIALRRISDGQYLLFSNREAGGQANRSHNWETLGWDAIEINAAVTGDAAGEMYAIDIIDAYSGGWGWLGVDDVTVVPEPATMTLLGLASVFCLRRKRQ